MLKNLAQDELGEKKRAEPGGPASSIPLPDPKRSQRKKKKQGRNEKKGKPLPKGQKKKSVWAYK